MLDLSTYDRAFIIAEAGTSHADPNPDERFRKAMRYVLAARDAGADCIKFQMFDGSKLFCPYPGDEQREPRWLNSRLDFGGWCQVKEFTEACGMMFLASVFQYSTVRRLERLGVEATKVASRAAENFPYDEATGTLLISTGMKYPSCLDAIYLECESKYPSTRYWLAEVQGFSDHSGNPERAIDAIKRGCKLIEVHFYIDRLDAGPDLPASLNLSQLKTVCEARDK